MTNERKCPFCGGKRVDGEATFSADLGFGVVMVRSVPATVCSQCGEEWICDSAAKQLEAITEAARRNRNLVEVVPYPPSAA